MSIRNFPAQALHDHTGSDGVMGRIVDDDETPRGAVARVAVDDQGLLHFDIDPGNIIHLELLICRQCAAVYLRLLDTGFGR